MNALIDPYGGQKDLQAKVLRHVTCAQRSQSERNRDAAFDRLAVAGAKNE